MNLGIDLDDTLIQKDENKQWTLMPGVETYLPKLIGKGYKLHLITARKIDGLENVTMIVSQIESDLNVQFSSITCTDHETKGWSAAVKECCFLIDDNPRWVVDCEVFGVTPILFGKECKTWKDVYDFL